jgi:hypothetical protein
MYIVSMTVKIAHEAPIGILEKVDKITDYCYALVHLFETHPEYYDFFYNARHKLHRDVLLDNSIFELGTAFDEEKYAGWIEKLQPSFYVLPDVLENGEETIQNFINFVSNYSRLPGVKIGTVQGKTYTELVNCYQFMSETADMIAISFDLSYYQETGFGNNKLQRQCDGRIRLIKNLIADGVWNYNKPHHLLGCSLAKEFKFYREHCIHNIHSIDTSNPVVAGIKGYLYNNTHGLEIKPSQKLVEMIDHTVSDEEFARIEYNINCFRNIL